MVAPVDPALAQKEIETYLSKAASAYAADVVERVIGHRDPCVLVLPTGAGKSTIVPYAFIQSGYRILVATPRIVMCQNIVASFKALFPSVVVGRAFGGENEIPKDARLVVCTNGYLKNRLMSFIRNGQCASVQITDVIMLDEVHMGELDTHVIVSLWYYCSTKFADTVRMPRLLLSSATVGDVLYSRMFSPCVTLPSEKFVTPYEISIQWASQDYKLNDMTRFSHIGQLIRQIHDSRPVEERILAFVPGIGPELTFLDQAAGLKDGVDCDVVLINSHSTAEETAKIFRSKDERRMIIVATPSADAGLTVSNLYHVIDSLLVKNMHLQDNGVNSLITELASIQLSKQRMGRVGRIGPGTYYPMCTEEFYNSGALSEGYDLEIMRVPLYSMVVELVGTGIPVEEVLGLYKIPSLPGTVDQLLKWGMIRRSEKSGVLFPSSGGKFMNSAGINNPRLSGVLYAWVRLGYPPVEGTVLIQLMCYLTSQLLKLTAFQAKPEGKSGGNRERQDFVRKMYGRFLGPSDIHSAIRVWNALMRETPEPETDPKAVERWCNANGLQGIPLGRMRRYLNGAIKNVEVHSHQYALIDGITQDPSPKFTVINNESLVVDERKVLPILRRFVEYIYDDEIGIKGKQDSQNRMAPLYVMKDGTTIKPGDTLSVHLDQDTATPWPERIAIIGKRINSKGKLTFTQFLDLDDPDKILPLSTEVLQKKLGIFVKTSSQVQ